ncbi:MAG TPA: TetR/AcrR family transcriptional regulator [Thermoleophilaceae bacterium]
MTPERLTRKQRQAHTRECLMLSAARVAARRGLERASLDEVASDAGFTKGAVYANFRSKEDLFLAMLDEHFDARLADVDRVLASGDAPERQARQAAADFIQALEREPEWNRLFFEFALYASRNEPFREEFVARTRALRARIAALLERRVSELGIDAPLPVDQIAAMTFAMPNGAGLQPLIEQDARTDELFPAMMVTFFAGLQAQTSA